MKLHGDIVPHNYIIMLLSVINIILFSTLAALMALIFGKRGGGYDFRYSSVGENHNNVELPCRYNILYSYRYTLKSAISWSCWTGPLLYISCLMIFSTFTFRPKNEWECLLVMPSCMVHSDRSPKIFLLKKPVNRSPWWPPRFYYSVISVVDETCVI